MSNFEKEYSGPERRKSFWRRFLYPLPERRVSQLYIGALKRRVAVVFVLTVVIAMGLAVVLDNTLGYFAKNKQLDETNHIIFEINTYVEKLFNEALPHLVVSEEVFSVLKGMQPPDNINLVQELQVARGVLGASLVYVMDRSGTVVGCSPYADGKTLTGNNYRFRPYFTEAMAGSASQYAALGVTTGERGIYFSHPVVVEEKQKPIGVVVIKISLAAIDSYLARRDNIYQSMLLSPDGIVFASTRDDWLFRAALPVTDSRRNELMQSRQFSDKPLGSLTFKVNEDMVRIGGSRHLVNVQPLELEGWNVATLKPFPFPYAMTFVIAFLVFLAGVIVILVSMFIYKDELLTAEVQRGREKRRRAEESRKVTLRELEAILDASLVGIVFVKDGIITNVNAKMCSILGYSEENMLGSDVRQYFSSKEGFRRFVRMYARQLARKDIEHIEYILRRKDGTVIPCSLSGRAIDMNDLSQGIVWVVEDIRDRKKAEKELERAKEEAESASQAKTKFLANMSHEIRTPMNGIIGLTEFLLQKGNDPVQRSKLRLIHSSGKRLMRIINDILEFSKNEIENIAIELSPFSLYDTILEVINNFEVSAAEKGIGLELEFDKGLPEIVEGDDFRIMQVMFNLVGNGIKFTEQGRVKVRVMQQQSTDSESIMVLFEVIDTGIGIAPENQGLIFEAFTQADSSHSRKYGGTGLGLPISRRIVQQMGGEIHLTSSVGNGARFWFVLPFSPHKTYEGKQHRAETTDSLNQYPETCSGHILLAEDDFINTTLAVSLLEQVGYTVKTVSNGQAAIDAWKEEDFDCILMDIQMPLLDGHKAAGVIRKLEQEKGGHVPIVAMSACGIEDEHTKFILAGMDAYIAKPINRVELFKILKKLITRSTVAENPEDITGDENHG